MIWKRKFALSECIFNLLGILSVAARTRQTVIAFIKDTVELDCSLARLNYPQWKGPSAEGVILYNVNGWPTFVNTELGEKKDRLSWGNNTKDIVIKNIQKVDQGEYQCAGVVFISLEVRGTPQSLEYDHLPDVAQYLSVNGVTLKCKTDCFYSNSAPTFSWFYTAKDASRQQYNISIPPKEETESTCTDSEKAYSSTLTFAQYTTFIDNVDATVRFVCGITSYLGRSKDLSTPMSPEITFAVKITHITLKDGSTELTSISNITVTSGVRKTLTCSPTISRPAATIVWYIDDVEKQKNTSTHYTITPSNNDHGKHIYCKAFNIQPANQAVFTEKTLLYVQLQVSSVALSVDGSNMLSGQDIHEINGVEKTLTCTPGTCRPCRPKATIVWYIGNVKQTTTGTRFTFTPTSSDHGKTVYCKAYNIQPEQWAVVSYKPKLYIRSSPHPSDHAELVTNITKALHENVTLSMTVTAYPAPSMFVWSKLQAGSTWTPLTSDKYIKIVTHNLQSSLTISDILTYHFGQYKLDVDNGVGDTCSQIFYFSQQDKPEAPTDLRPLHATVTESTITVEWKPGFNGGLHQPFYVEYTKPSDAHWSVEEVPEPATNVTLNGLTPGAKYVVRIYSQNSIGKSTVIGLETFVTLASVMTPPHIQAGLIAGGVVGCMLLTVVVIMSRLLWRRYRSVGCLCCKDTERKENSIARRRTDEPVYSNDVSTLGEYENGILLESIIRDTETTYESTVPENVKDHIYSEINNSSPENETNALENNTNYINLSL